MTDTDYTFGAHKDLPDGEDNRRQYRLIARAEITLELEAEYPATEGESESQARELVCAIRDISASGLCLLATECLASGALYPASVVLGHHDEHFILTLEVVWCRPDKGSYLVGARIIESDQTAYVEWTDAVARAMSAP
ncbi:PilZ domain-containing protein [Marinobacter salexigens]|uniref:PilZ domain-containing protein n=1 Tax=Marinobacter salexigens TaxID=1925763 RepID=UPI000C28C55C|nr:PilZ domain-containing protein [Marinobacter salexigens]